MSPKAALLSLVFLPVLTVSLAGQSDTQGQIELHSRQAQQYLSAHRPDLAIPELEKVVALDPGNVDARANLGVLLFFRGDARGAMPQLRAALAIKPDLWRLRGLLGLAEGQLHDSRSSRSDLEAAFPHIADEKFQLDVGKALVDDYTSTGDLDKAAVIVSSLLANRPTDATLLYLAYRINTDLADQAMLTLALTAPDSAEMHQVMARELARHGDDTPAIANYREAIKLDPKLPGVHFELGELLDHSSDETLKAGAQAEFEAALAVNPRDEKAELALGMTLEKKGDLKTALAADTRALELNPNDTDACTESGKVLVEMSRKEQAQKMFERAIGIDPSNYVAHYRLAALYRQQGKTEEAKEQVADYLKYKEGKDKLEKIFQNMRVASGQHPDNDDPPAVR
ncbi:MAG TPA: tetratricopeptide repeat protein [Acidobacteriaceae bacterium]|jgi:tetratricopeptide (TPR) repeat protein|nr:tetratricopeptide repeat protein [Acidobacteriaceae bacterium]